MKAKRLLFQTAIIPLLILFSPAMSSATAEIIDTTRVREVKKARKSTGEILADIPGEIVKLPLRTVRFLSFTISTSQPVSKIFQLIDFSRPASKYIPIVGYSPNAGLKFGFGLRKIEKLHWDDRLDFKWYYSTHDYQSYQFRFRFREFFQPYAGIDLYFRYKKRPRESLYGIGMDSRRDNRASYTLENTELRLDIPFRTAKHITFGLTGGFVISNFYDGRNPDTESSLDSISIDPQFDLNPGRLDNSRYITAGAIFEYDGRNSGGRPSNGFHILSRFVRYMGTGRSKGLGLYETKVDIRHYVNVWRMRILATRIYFQRFDGDNGNDREMPINLTSKLGGSDILRGYTTWRFRDNDLLYASVEWRFPVWRILDGFVFLDEGRVYNEISDARVFRRWKYSTGFGLRVWNHRKVSLMTTIAVSDEDTRFYLETSAGW